MTSPVDHSVLQNLREEIGDNEFLRDLIDTYLEEAPRLLDNIQHAIDHHDAEAMKNAAHTLKSTSATFGARDLAALCQEIETLGRAGDTNGRALQRAADISALFETVRSALEAERGSG